MLYTVNVISTRQRILNYLSEHKTATTSELSRVLKLTPADVRHHISQLIYQGGVSVIGKRSSPGRGRPAHLFTLTEPDRRNNFAQLSHSLLTEFANSGQDPEDYQLLDILASHFVGDVPWKTESFTRKLIKTVKYLSEQNYDASWEAHIGSPRLILGHCPYKILVDNHPELCLLDAKIIHSLLGKPVRQIEKLTLTERGLRQCVFLVSTNSQ